MDSIIKDNFNQILGAYTTSYTIGDGVYRPHSRAKYPNLYTKSKKLKKVLGLQSLAATISKFQDFHIALELFLSIIFTRFGSRYKAEYFHSETPRVGQCIR